LTVVDVEMPVDDGDPVFGMPTPLFRLPGTELDNPVEVYGDEVIVASGAQNPQASIPMLVSDWRRLLVD
jgi:hypothetical protein